jgi:enamine deaminase RidA (YjgF/YER057c/UK114 family)
MPRAAKRQQGKAHAMPAPTSDPAMKKQMMMMPPPVRFGSNNRSSQSVSFNNIIYLSGQHAQDLTKDIQGQAEEVCEAVDKLLAESMSDKTKIIRADIFLKDKSMFKQMNEVWEKWVDPQFAPPVTTAVVADFPVDGVLVEVTIIAAVSKDQGEGTAEEEGVEGQAAEAEGKEEEPADEKSTSKA